MLRVPRLTTSGSSHHQILKCDRRIAGRDELNAYVIELGDAVRKEKQFKEKNDEQLGTGKPCLYVGMTRLAPVPAYGSRNRPISWSNRR